jgi:hypothetical protein
MNNRDNKIAVYGIYQSRFAAENAVEKLKDEKFRNSDISVLFASPETNKEFAHHNSTKAPEGAITGTAAGASVGGILGWLAGIGSLAIPGLGPLIAAGPIVGALAGVGVGGTVGGIVGGLIGIGIPEYEARRYEGRVTSGGVLLSVHADQEEWSRTAQRILKETGAEDIGTKTEDSAPQAAAV